MARIGVTQQDVYLIANRLLEDGATPTVEKIRRKLGTGSNTTSNNYLKKWKEEKTTQEIAGVPAHLIQSLKNVYDGMKTEFELELKGIRESHDSLTNKLHDNESVIKKEVAALKSENTSLNKRLSEVRALKGSLEQSKNLLSADLAVTVEKLNQVENFKDYIEKDNIQLKIEMDDLKRELKSEKARSRKLEIKGSDLQKKLESAKAFTGQLKKEIENKETAQKLLNKSEKEKLHILSESTKIVRKEKKQLENELERLKRKLSKRETK